MTDAQLDLMVLRTGVDRLRWATSDANPDAADRESSREWVRSMSALPEWIAAPAPEPEPDASPFVAPRPEPIPLADAQRARKLGFSRCWFSFKDEHCGCSGLQCDLLKRRVTLRDCVACFARRLP